MYIEVLKGSQSTGYLCSRCFHVNSEQKFSKMQKQKTGDYCVYYKSKVILNKFHHYTSV